jgi:hypothetical protein
MEIPEGQGADLIRERRAADDADRAGSEPSDPLGPDRDSAVMSKFGVEPSDLIERFTVTP